jgi:hypothetical protein
MKNEIKLPYRVFCIKKTNRRIDNNNSKSIENLFFDKVICHDNSSFSRFGSLCNLIVHDYNLIIKDIDNKNDLPKKTRSFIRDSIFYGRDTRRNRQSLLPSYYHRLISFIGDEIIKAKENHRIILAPDNELKAVQSNISDQLNNFRPHTQCFGFAKNRSAIDCANYHLFYNKKPELLVNLDIKNFFGSFNKKDMQKSLMAHGIIDEDIERILELCTVKLNNCNICQLVSMVVCSFIDFKKLYQTILQRLREDSPAHAHNSYVDSWYSRDIRQQIRANNRLFFSPSVFYGFSPASRENRELNKISEEIKILKHVVSILIEVIMTDALKLKIVDKKYLSEILKQLFNIGEMINAGDIFLPQGSPASPAITNICFKLLDYKLDSLAKENGAVYTRYADDLSFTWPKRFGKKFINIFIYRVSSLLKNNGFEINKNKSKVIGTGGRMEILGYIINSGKPTIPPAYFENVRSEIFALKEKVKLNKVKNHAHFNSIISKINGKINFIATASPKKADKLSNTLSSIHPPITSSIRRIELIENNNDDTN